MNTATKQKLLKRKVLLFFIFVSCFEFLNYGETNESTSLNFVFYQEEPAKINLLNHHDGTYAFIITMKDEPNQDQIDRQLVYLRKIPGFLSMSKDENGHLKVLTTEQISTSDRDHVLSIAARMCGFIEFVISE